MNDLIEALQIFLKYAKKDVYSPFHCEHDILYVHVGVTPDDVPSDDLARLEDIGFHWNDGDECFTSYRYGSC